MSDLAAAITQSLSKDGQTVPTADLPMGSFKHTGVGDPVLRNNYASLGWVQDGKDKRLINVTGVNQLEAILPGGGAAPVVGQIVQLIPTSTNTGIVTLVVNEGPEYDVITDIGNFLGAGNLVAGRTYLLSFTGDAWQIISASGGVTGFAQAAMSGWDRPSLNGPYPQITFVNPTTVFVPGGTGRIIHPSARDLSGVTEVTWAGQNVTISNVAVDWMTFLAVNPAGAIVQFTGSFNPAWARQNILLGTVAHLNGQINEITTQPAIFGDMTYAAYDTGILLNNTLVSGGKVLPNAASPFHVDLQAGTIFSLGADSSDVNGPNTGSFPAAFDLSFFPVTGNNAVGLATQNVPVTNYDPLGAGVITAIPGGVSTASIHRLFLVAGEFVFLYGQAIYADLTTALSQIGVDDASVFYPSKLVNATLLAYIVAQKNCTDLKNTATARIVAKGGSQFSIGTAGSISEAPINGLIYGRQDAAWAETIPAPKGPQATLRQIYYYTNTFARFSHGLLDNPEGGGNTGSDYGLRAYTDAGGLLGPVYTIDRPSQIMTVWAGLTSPALIQGAPLLSTSEVIATTNFRALGAGPAVLGNTTAGNVFIRPDGVAVTTSQTQFSAGGGALFNGTANCNVTSAGNSGIGSFTAFSSGANASRIAFTNGSFGEMGRIVGSAANTLLFQTGAAPVTRLQLNASGALIDDSVFVNKTTSQTLAVYTNIPSGLPANGAASGMRVSNYENVAGALVGVSFSFADTTDAERHAAGIIVGKEGPWTGGSGLYPAYMGFWTRISGGTQNESFRIASTGAITVNPSATTVPHFNVNPISNGTEGRIRVGDSGATAGLSNVSIVESIGARNDANGTFPGRIGASFRRTDGTAIAAQSLGMIGFGGQWGTGTTFNQTQLLYPASIQGVAEGSFTAAGAMPTGLSFRTGIVGDRLDAVNVPYGTERLRISSTGLATFTGNVVSADYFATTNGNAVFGPAGSGNVILRPQGPANSTGQMLLGNAGSVSFAGTITGAQDFISSTTLAQLAPTGTGSVRFRPNGTASAVGEFSIASTGIVNHGNLAINTAAVLTTNPIAISGAFTGGGRLITFTNTDVSTGSLAGVTLKSGSSVGTTFADYATEYTGVAQFQGRFGLENSNASGGIAYSALGATGTHTWYQGAARTQMMQISSAGLSVTGNIGFYGTAAQAKPTVTGSRGANAALTSLCTALATLGLITNSTS